MSMTIDDEPRPTYKRIPRELRGFPVPEFVRHPRKRMERYEFQQHYYYALTLGADGTHSVYRFAWPSDRALWVAQGAQGTRQSVRAGDEKVRAAKEAVDRGEYEWPTPEWKRPA